MCIVSFICKFCLVLIWNWDGFFQMFKLPKLKWSVEEERILLNLVEEEKVPGTDASLKQLNDNPSARDNFKLRG